MHRMLCSNRDNHILLLDTIGGGLTVERYRERPLTQVRRKDRVLADEEWMDRFLTMSAVGHLAVTYEGQPLVHSNFFWFDGTRIYWHTAQVGKLRAILETGVARACFTVTE